jgi:hypothetical protein
MRCPPVLTAAVAALAIGLASPAEAALIRVDFAGANSSPTGATATNNPWGTPVPSLTGYVIYDSAAAGVPFSATATNYPNAIKEISFSMGGASPVLTGIRTGNFGSIQVANQAGSDSLSFNNLTLSPAQLAGEVPTLFLGTATRTFNNAQLTLRLEGPNTVLADQALFGPFDPAAFSTRKQLTVFLAYTQQGTTPPGQTWPTVNFVYNLDPVGVSVVPVPAAGLLWLSAAGVLAAVRRRSATAA